MGCLKLTYSQQNTTLKVVYRNDVQQQKVVQRFLNIDPLAAKYPYNSPYAFSENVVINSRELEGLERSFCVTPTQAAYLTKLYNAGDINEIMYQVRNSEAYYEWSDKLEANKQTQVYWYDDNGKLQNLTFSNAKYNENYGGNSNRDKVKNINVQISFYKNELTNRQEKLSNLNNEIDSYEIDKEVLDNESEQSGDPKIGYHISSTILKYFRNSTLEELYKQRDNEYKVVSKIENIIDSLQKDKKKITNNEL